MKFATVEDVLIFPNFRETERFKRILSPCLFDEGGLQCRMWNGYFSFWMKDICGYYCLELENIFVGNGW